MSILNGVRAGSGGGGIGAKWRVALPVLGTAAVGVGLAVAPQIALLIVASAALSLMLLVAARRAVRWQGSMGAPQSCGERKDTVVEDTESMGLRFARGFYYLGLLSIGLLTVRPILSLTLSDLLFFGSLVGALIHLSRKRSGIRGSIPKGVLPGVAIFAVGGLISSASSHLPGDSIGIVAKFVYITLVWFWVGTIVLERPDHVRTAVSLWVLSAAATGAAAIVQLRFGDIVPGGAIAWDRMTGFTGQVNELGGVTSVALVPAMMLATRAKGFMHASGAYLSLFVVAGALILSGSVGGMVAAVSAGLIWLALIRLQARAALVLASIALASLFVLSAQSSTGVPSPLQRVFMVTATNGASGTFWSRMEINQLAWRTISANPLVGVGLDSESSVTEAGFQVHNSLLGAWYEAGLLGLVGFTLLLAVVLACGRRAAVMARNSQEWVLIITLLVSCIAWTVYGMGAPVLYKRYGWIAAVLILSLRAQQQRGYGASVSFSPRRSVAPRQSVEQ